MNADIIRQCENCGRNFERIRRTKNKQPRQFPHLPCGYGRKFCASCQTNRQRQKRKKQAVEYAGGKCAICGYSRCLRVLAFHHLNPNEKEFEMGKSLCCAPDTLRHEIDKCVLLCANCHLEVHEGIAKIPNCLPPRDPSKLCGHTRGPQQTRLCLDCGKTISKQSKRCCKCAILNRKGKHMKIIWPSIEELDALLQSHTQQAVAEMLGVSDSAVHKHRKMFGHSRPSQHDGRE